MLAKFGQVLGFGSFHMAGRCALQKSARAEHSRNASLLLPQAGPSLAKTLCILCMTWFQPLVRFVLPLSA